MPSPASVHERDRLDAVGRYDILDTPSEESFDRITRLTRRLFDVPMSTVTIIDGHRQWFKSRQGVEACETDRGPALCDVAIRQPDLLIVPDTLADPRFETNPFVVGTPNIRFYAGAPLRSPEGLAIGTLCAMDTRPRAFTPEHAEALRDLASLVMSELELRQLAMTDSLTGSLSRRAFREEFARTLALALRHRHALSCLVFDLDHFKSINDRYGHPVGDLVLSAVTGLCRQELRRSDPLGRMGGEEFAVLLPHTGAGSALEVAEKLRGVIERLSIPTPHGALSVTASFGVAGLDRSVSDIDTLLERADAALYAAKARGRNACTDWRPAEAAPPSATRRVLKAGRIAYNGGRSSIDCTVRGLSGEAASLKVLSTAGVPDKFTLVIEADGFSRPCEVSTITEQTIEVAFV